MKRNLRGLTLVELMIVVAVVGVFSTVVAMAACSGPAQKNAAKGEAKKWADELGLKYTGISCADYDSDNDGYVSCTLAMTDGETKQIECRGAYSIGHGCRDPKLTIRHTQ